MWKKVLIAVGAVVLVGGSVLATYLILDHAHQADIEQLSSTVAEYQEKIDAIGPIVTCYTPISTIEPGTQITAEMLTTQSIPSSMTNDDFVLDLSYLNEMYTDENGNHYIGYYAKTYIQPGTPITQSLLMTEDLPDSARELDITGNRWPIGLKEGDYVDIRITYTYGEDFIVLPHKRVYEINNQTLKMHMTEEEMHIYQAALVDWYISADKGTDLYFTKYIEPGVQEAAVPYYTVPLNIATMCEVDPNIVNEAQVAFKDNLYKLQTQYRDAGYTDEELGQRSSSEGTLINSGRQDLNGRVNSDYTEWYQEYLEMKEREKEQAENDSLIDGGVG